MVPPSNYKVCVINIIVSYVGGEQLRTSMKATSLPSSTVDQLQKKTIYSVLNKILCMLIVLFIMCGHCSPVVVWSNYHGI